MSQEIVTEILDTKYSAKCPECGSYSNRRKNKDQWRCTKFSHEFISHEGYILVRSKKKQ